MTRFTVEDTNLSGLRVVIRQRIGDSRGFLSRMFCAVDLEPAGWLTPVAQINHTRTSLAGAVRGMHFQNPPHAEMKLVSCVRGEVWDVAVDLRENSPTFLQWYGRVLSEENLAAMLVPQGFAHGFQTLSANCELVYLHTAPYVPSAEAGIRFDDPRLGIRWPRPVTEVSPRDQTHPLIDARFSGIRFP